MIGYRVNRYFIYTGMKTVILLLGIIFANTAYSIPQIENHLNTHPKLAGMVYSTCAIIYTTMNADLRRQELDRKAEEMFAKCVSATTVEFCTDVYNYQIIPMLNIFNDGEKLSRGVKTCEKINDH